MSTWRSTRSSSTSPSTFHRPPTSWPTGNAGRTWLGTSSALCRGPEPRPGLGRRPTDAAVDTELGILKTGKEADVFLLERAVPGDPTAAS